MPQSTELLQVASTSVINTVNATANSRKERQNSPHPTYRVQHSNDEISYMELVDPEGMLSRLLAAAVINRRLRNALLTNPRVVLKLGYQGEPFMLSAAELEVLLAVRADTLVDFARLLLKAVEAHNERLLTSYQSPI